MTAPVPSRPLPAPAPLLPFEPEMTAAPEPSPRLWDGWQGDLRFFLTAYLAGFVFFLALLS